LLIFLTLFRVGRMLRPMGQDPDDPLLWYRVHNADCPVDGRSPHGGGSLRARIAHVCCTNFIFELRTGGLDESSPYKHPAEVTGSNPASPTSYIIKYQQDRIQRFLLTS
jgi:hypothetical protein